MGNVTTLTMNRCLGLATRVLLWRGAATLHNTEHGKRLTSHLLSKQPYYLGVQNLVCMNISQSRKSTARERNMVVRGDRVRKKYFISLTFLLLSSSELKH